jgi:hypothetical protein
MKSAWDFASGSRGSADGKGEDTNTPDQAAVAAQPGLFSVSVDQLGHLQIVSAKQETWPLAIQTTGTVDLDNDHTSQAITQVNRSEEHV